MHGHCSAAYCGCRSKTIYSGESAVPASAGRHRSVGGAIVNENQSQTESLLDIEAGVRHRTIMLPEFQRDFRWELEQTYDLFDSLIRDILKFRYS